ncbi:LysR substrate-binding domain-containing protein [Luteimonas kalidii]|uniref:LysR substrate-binding domain-containing protein n=1 Tax=Luteimonas kalidii TaxID=3042025 RepID=A0ABT6JVY7_9GAMM|nr:LysR substrate-binding domain-containing protein [Luteimonas kalidii]MDH5834858.1 LysR substrate-binding domain-containing protein [Luteimonas kalidii]
MDRFDALQAFVRVVETGSFTRAAESLRISRTSATQLVQQLEQRLRVRLLNRTTRRVALTSDGAAFFDQAVRLLADLAEAEASVVGAAAAPGGRLRVDVPSPFARLVLIPALPAFHARYPELALELGVSDRVVDLVDDNVDCVVRGGTLADQSLVARKLVDLRMGCFAAPGYLARAGVPGHPGDLSDHGRHRVVAFQSMRRGVAVLPMDMQRTGERVQVRGRHMLAVDDGNAYVAAGVAGLGVVTLPTYIARAHVAAGELVEVLPEWRIDPLPLFVAWRPNRHVSARLRVFVDWLVAMVVERRLDA